MKVNRKDFKEMSEYFKRRVEGQLSINPHKTNEVYKFLKRSFEITKKLSKAKSIEIDDTIS